MPWLDKRLDVRPGIGRLLKVVVRRSPGRFEALLPDGATPSTLRLDEAFPTSPAWGLVSADAIIAERLVDALHEFLKARACSPIRLDPLVSPGSLSCRTITDYSTTAVSSTTTCRAPPHRSRLSCRLCYGRTSRGVDTGSSHQGPHYRHLPCRPGRSPREHSPNLRAVSDSAPQGHSITSVGSSGSEGIDPSGSQTSASTPIQGAPRRTDGWPPPVEPVAVGRPFTPCRRRSPLSSDRPGTGMRQDAARRCRLDAQATRSGLRRQRHRRDRRL